MSDQDENRPLTRRELRLRAMAAAGTSPEAETSAPPQANEPIAAGAGAGATSAAAEINIPLVDETGRMRSRRELRELREQAEAALAEAQGAATAAPTETETDESVEAAEVVEPAPEADGVEAGFVDDAEEDEILAALGAIETGVPLEQAADEDEFPYGDTLSSDGAVESDAPVLVNGEPLAETVAFDVIADQAAAREADEAAAQEGAEAEEHPESRADAEAPAPEIAPAQEDAVESDFDSIFVVTADDEEDEDEDEDGKGDAAADSVETVDVSDEDDDAAGQADAGDLDDRGDTGPKPAAVKAGDGYSFPDIAPLDEGQSVFDDPAIRMMGAAGAQQPAEAPNGDFDELISRAVAQEGSTHSSSTSALILPNMPESEGLAGPLGDTGELFITGSIDLPKSLSETGGHAALHDSVEAEPFDALGLAEAPAGDNEMAPVSASRAVSARGSQGPLVAEATKDKSKLPVALIATGGVLVVGAVGLVIWAATSGLFG